MFNGASAGGGLPAGLRRHDAGDADLDEPLHAALVPGDNCDVPVDVTFPSATFPSGTNVTNSFTADATPLGQPSQPFGPGSVTHPVTTFVPNASAGFSKNMAGGTPNPPTLNQAFSYDLVPSNNGNVPLDNLIVVDTLPIELQVASVTTGSYSTSRTSPPASACG